MSANILSRNERAHPAFFWLGVALVTIGVVMHLPMYARSAAMNFHVAGMPIDGWMIVGMALILAGTAAGYYGLLPAALKRESAAATAAQIASIQALVPKEAAGKLKWAHWQLLITLSLGLIIDSMKPASLGFVVPGTAKEYGLSREIVALFPFCALTGLVVGSYVWGMIADMVGRRAAILLSGIMFVGTSICGSMPAFQWNLFMCFLMGLAAGGMLPITYTLLAECIPTRHRGWTLVLVGGLGLIGGYFAASGCAALFEPYFGWRIMWFLNAPTGLMLIACNLLIPESARFLLARGRVTEARALVERFGVQIDIKQGPGARKEVDSASALLRWPYRGTTATLNLSAIAWGLVNFGLLLWLPADLRERGYSVAGSDVLLFRSALIALPTMFAIAWLYSKWSTKWTLFVLIVLTALGLVGLSLIDAGVSWAADNMLVLLSVLMLGVNGIIAVLLPYSAENYPVLVRGRGTGMVAGCSKLGGLAAQGVAVAALVPGLGAASLVLAVPMAVSAGMVARYGKETRNRGLE